MFRRLTAVAFLAVLANAAPALALPGESETDVVARYQKHAILGPMEATGNDDPQIAPTSEAVGKVGAAKLLYKVWADEDGIWWEQITVEGGKFRFTRKDAAAHGLIGQVYDEPLAKDFVEAKPVFAYRTDSRSGAVLQGKRFSYWTENGEDESYVQLRPASGLKRLTETVKFNYKADAVKNLNDF